VEELYLRHVPGLEVALGEPHAELGVLVATLDVIGGQTAEVGKELALGQQAGAAQRGHRSPLGGAVEAAVQALEGVRELPAAARRIAAELDPGVLDRAVVVEQLRGDGAGLRQRVVGLGQLRQPAGPVGQNVGVEQEQQPAAGE